MPPAKGIPDREDLGDASKLNAGELLRFVLQRHKALRAGEHTDLRIGDKDRGLFSWAVRKGLPTPKQKHLAVRQPLHSFDYGGYEGKIESGYGAGEVKKERDGEVLVTKVTPKSIYFSTADERYPQRFVLLNTDAKNWLLINSTPTEPVPYAKVHYAKIPKEQVEPVLAKLKEGSSVQAKIDGASSLVKILKDRPELFSYRTSSVTKRPILHSERVFRGLPSAMMPKELVGTVAKGELYGDQGGKVISPQALGGLLNSVLGKSIRTQQADDITIKSMLYDLQQLGDKSVLDLPYSERMRLLKEKVLPNLPSEHFSAPEEATTPEDALSLWKTITSGKHPLTREGIVIHPPTGVPSKVKLDDEYDVYIRDFFPGKGRLTDSGVGGFKWSWDPEGPIVGEVGSGLDDGTRRQMMEDPSAFIGRIARVKAQDKLPSGALRMPSLLAIHEG